MNHNLTQIDRDNPQTHFNDLTILNPFHSNIAQLRPQLKPAQKQNQYSQLHFYDLIILNPFHSIIAQLRPQLKPAQKQNQL